jgi:hypothetical protein
VSLSPDLPFQKTCYGHHYLPHVKRSIVDNEQIALLEGIVNNPNTLHDVRLAIRQAIEDSQELNILTSSVSSFEHALIALKDGKRIARSGWNGKGMFAYLVPAASYPVQTGAAKEHFGEGSLVPYRAYMALKTVDEDVAVWVPSVSDILADDWVVL